MSPSIIMPNNGRNTTPAQRFQAMTLAEAENHVTYSKLSKEKEVMTIEEVNQEVTYGPTTRPSGRNDISAVRQVGGLAVAGWRSMRWKPMRGLMRRTGEFGVVAGTVIFSGASYLNTYKIVWGCISAVRELLVSISVPTRTSANVAA